jgi:hypothetical protein
VDRSQVEQDTDLLVALAGVPDPRKARGCRHRLITVLAVSVCAVLAGARSYVAIAEWAHDLPVGARLRLGIGRQAPSESTIRRILQAVDIDALDAALSSWLAMRLPDPPSGRMRVVAVDGKTARGARADDGTQVHLLAAFEPATGVVLGQTQEAPISVSRVPGGFLVWRRWSWTAAAASTPLRAPSAFQG